MATTRATDGGLGVSTSPSTSLFNLHVWLAHADEDVFEGIAHAAAALAGDFNGGAQDALQFHPAHGAGQDVFAAMVRLALRQDAGFQA